MKTVLQRLDEIAATSSKKEKERLVLEGLTDDPWFEFVCKQALDPFRTYGIRPLRPQEVRDERPLGAIVKFEDIQRLLDRLASRTLTGNAAMDETLMVFNSMALDDAELLWRVIMKDLKAGFTASTVNRVKPGTIPVFEVMLAHKYEEKRIKAWPVSVEPKLDGVRVICVVTPGQAKFYSRTGKEFPALAHLEPVILKGFEAAWTYEVNEGDRGAKAHKRFFRPEGLVLDGEMVSGSFNKSVGDIRRKDEEATDAVFNLFDVLPMADFAARDEIALPYAVRRWAVVSFRSFCNDPRVIATRRFEARSDEEVQAYYRRFRDEGYEGAIVKPNTGTYSKSRSYAWLKMKGQESGDYRVISAFPGEPHTKYADCLGGLIVDVDGVSVRVGGGFSDAQRREFWKAYEEDTILLTEMGDTVATTLLGRMIEVEFHEKTPDGSLRHPRFVRMRPDKEPIF